MILKCGCEAYAVRDDGTRTCPVHRCDQEAEKQPDLTGRTARCGCGAEEPSSEDLPFFRYRGPGSPEYMRYCVCGYHERADCHRSGDCEFTPSPNHPDEFYCGCRGWD